MGLPVAVAEFLFFENSYRPIVGDIGFIGRQTTVLTEKALETLRVRYGVTPPPSFSIEYDTQTAGHERYGGHKFITDRCLVSLFGGKFLSIDVSDYEGADLITDLSFPIPSEHYNKFDFIYDGSCLDNIFNPAAAIVNMSKMLRPGGRLVSLNHATHFNAPYTTFSPSWFFDFFVVNKYQDCKVYLCVFLDDDKFLHTESLPTLYYNWKKGAVGGVPSVPEKDMHIMLLVIAEKGDASTDDRQPVQSLYRDQAYNDEEFVPNVETIFKSPRPVFGHSPFAEHDKKYVICQHLGKDVHL